MYQRLGCQPMAQLEVVETLEAEPSERKSGLALRGDIRTLSLSCLSLCSMAAMR